MTTKYRWMGRQRKRVLKYYRLLYEPDLRRQRERHQQHRRQRRGHV